VTDNINMIAAGSSNAAGLKPLYALNPPLFTTMRRAVQTEWHGFQGVALTGARQSKTWGLPWVTWSFGVISAAEYAYLQATFGPNITLRAYNKTLNTWNNYNATLTIVDLGDSSQAQWGRLYNWEQLRLTFLDLVAL